ncbi:hypothetical protein Tco_0636550, partial [Tanacetum coccineum]
VNLKSGEAVVFGKKQKVWQRRCREDEEKEE